MEFDGINNDSATFNQKCASEGIRIGSAKICNDRLDYDWGLKHLAQPTFEQILFDGSQKQRLIGKLYPEAITFHDCHFVESDFLMSIPNCKSLTIVSTNKQKLKKLPQFS